MTNDENKTPWFFKLVAIVVLFLGIFFIFLDVLAMFSEGGQIGTFTTSTLLGINLIFQSLMIWKGLIPLFKSYNGHSAE